MYEKALRFFFHLFYTWDLSEPAFCVIIVMVGIFQFHMEVFFLHLMSKWVITLALVLALCTGAAVAETYYQTLPVEGIANSLKITVDVPGENPVIDGINPLTGETWYDYYYPIAVNIDSHPDALPHWGVASADIIYEMPVQKDGSTRSVALFMGEIPAFAGPIRSGRVPHASVREMWDSVWVF